MKKIQWTRTETTIAGQPHLSYAADIKGNGYMVQKENGRWFAARRCERIGEDAGYTSHLSAMAACYHVAGVKRPVLTTYQESPLSRA